MRYKASQNEKRQLTAHHNKIAPEAKNRAYSKSKCFFKSEII